MNLGRIFASAIVRRLAYVLVTIALAWLGVGDARAQTFPNCTATYTGAAECANRQVAFQTAVAAAAYQCSLLPSYNACVNPNDGIDDAYNGPSSSPVGSYRVRYCYAGGCSWGPRRSYNVECPEGYQWDAVNNSCGVPCGDAPASLPPSWAVCPSSDQNSCPLSVCNAGCEYLNTPALNSGGNVTLITIDGQTYIRTDGWTVQRGASCTSSADMPDLSEPPTDTDGDGSSDANDSAPNNPGSGTDTPQDGSSACGGPNQPECGENGEGSGSGNGNTSGGGGDCTTPPVSTGDAILAQIAYQTWATRCAITGTGNAGPGGGTGTGTGNGSGNQPDWTKGDGPAVPTDDTDYVNDQTHFGLGISPNLLDQENIFGNASCPAFELHIWTVTVSSSDVPGWCTLVTILRGLILIFGAFSALQILMGRGLV